MIVVILGLQIVDRNREEKRLKAQVARLSAIEREITLRHSWYVTISPKGGVDSKITLDDRDPIDRLCELLKAASAPVFKNGAATEENDLGVIDITSSTRDDPSLESTVNGAALHLTSTRGLGRLHVLRTINADSKRVGVRNESGGKFYKTVIEDAESLMRLQENLCRDRAEMLHSISSEHH